MKILMDSLKKIIKINEKYLNFKQKLWKIVEKDKF